MTGRLSTHVLDTARGRPAAGMRITLDRLAGENRSRIAEAVTNADGRTDAPLLAGDALTAGTYELVFCAGDYLRRTGLTGEDPPFLDEIPIRVGLAAGQHYHVPLLLSPFGYATYRGS
ncbi:MAG: hydroxyisourate hydrolase [Gemmobacter sp.]